MKTYWAVIKNIHFLLVFLLLAAVPATASDTLLVKDLSEEWIFYHPGKEQYLPLVDHRELRGKTIHFQISDPEQIDTYLKVSSIQEVSLFVNNQLLSTLKGDTLLFSLRDVKSYVGFPLQFTLYSPRLTAGSIKTEMVTITGRPPGKIGEVPLTFKRERSSFAGFFTLALVVILIFTAILYYYFPRTFMEYFKISRAFSFRETEENLLKSRPISQVNFYFYLFFCLLVALVLMTVAHLGDIRLSHPGPFIYNSLGEGIWRWSKLILAVFAWLVIKFILINNMAWLFKLGSFNNNHFYNHIRINLVILLVILAVIVLSYFSFHTVAESFYQALFYLSLVLIALGILVIYLKLMNAGNFKNVHLFSYLCATELIPFGVIISSGLNQPF